MKLDLSRPLQRLVAAGIMAGVILALTMVVAIPIPHMAGAYVNLGDAGVYLAAFLLGSPAGALCAAVGSALADILLGGALYAIPTFIIKGLMALIAATLIKRWKGKRVLALLVAGIIMPVGYLAFETALYGFATAFLGVPANLIQYVAGIALSLPMMRILERFQKSTEKPSH